jgi:hypothetical protein
MSQEVSRPLCNPEDIAHLLIWITRSHACRAGMGTRMLCGWEVAHEEATGATDEYHTNFTLKQIGMFDRTIVRLDHGLNGNPQEPGAPSLNDAWRACSINERSPPAFARSHKPPWPIPEDLAAVCDVELTVRALSTFKDGQSATPECFSETGSALQPC